MHIDDGLIDDTLGQYYGRTKDESTVNVDPISQWDQRQTVKRV